MEGCHPSLHSLRPTPSLINTSPAGKRRERDEQKGLLAENSLLTGSFYSHVADFPPVCRTCPGPAPRRLGAGGVPLDPPHANTPVVRRGMGEVWSGHETNMPEHAWLIDARNDEYFCHGTPLQSFMRFSIKTIIHTSVMIIITHMHTKMNL